MTKIPYSDEAIIESLRAHLDKISLIPSLNDPFMKDKNNLNDAEKAEYREILRTSIRKKDYWYIGYAPSIILLIGGLFKIVKKYHLQHLIWANFIPWRKTK